MSRHRPILQPIGMIGLRYREPFFSQVISEDHWVIILSSLIKKKKKIGKSVVKLLSLRGLTLVNTEWIILLEDNFTFLFEMPSHPAPV